MVSVPSLTKYARVMAIPTDRAYSPYYSYSSATPMDSGDPPQAVPDAPRVVYLPPPKITMCKTSGCNQQACFNLKNVREPLYCGTHKKDKVRLCARDPAD